MAVAIVVYVSLLSADAFYAKFGIFPSPRIVLDFFAAPSAFVAYTQSGTSFWDLVTVGVAAVVIGAAVTESTRCIWSERRVAWRPAANLVFGAALLWAICAYPRPERDREHAFLMAEHSLPVVKYVFQALTAFDSNGLQHARSLVPRAMPAAGASLRPRARHVVLVLAECLRADHLPAYGYQRNTTPFVQSESADWIAFDRAYAHGPRTADSFPVIFNAQYFAAVDGSNQGAHALWTSLRARSIGSAFLSAGAMEWGGIAHAMDLSSVDYSLIASSVDQTHRNNMSTLPFDYAVDDEIPLRRYVSLLEHELKDSPSFVTLHFVGSHYPFHYNDVPDEFHPSLRPSGDDHAGVDPGKTLLTYAANGNVPGAFLGRLANAYDNSILHIDRLIREVVEALRHLDMLDDSIVIFTADHGESLGEHRTLFHGTSLYEEQVHVPMLLRVGSNLSPIRGRLVARAADVVGEVDLMPTVLDALFGHEPTQSFDGTSWLSTAAKPYELLLFRGLGEQIGVVTSERKFVFDILGRRSEEYALRDDPREERNLANAPNNTLGGFMDHIRQAGAVTMLDAASLRPY